MKTLKEIKELVEKGENSSGFLYGYQYVIRNIYEDIRNSEVTSVKSIEKYLLDLMNKKYGEIKIGNKRKSRLKN